MWATLQVGPHPAAEPIHEKKKRPWPSNQGAVPTRTYGITSIEVAVAKAYIYGMHIYERMGIYAFRQLSGGCAIHADRI